FKSSTCATGGFGANVVGSSKKSKIPPNPSWWNNSYYKSTVTLKTPNASHGKSSSPPHRKMPNRLKHGRPNGVAPMLTCAFHSEAQNDNCLRPCKKTPTAHCDCINPDAQETSPHAQRHYENSKKP